MSGGGRSLRGTRAGRVSQEILRYVVSLLEHPLAVVATLLPVIVVRALAAAIPGRYDGDCWWVAAAGREMLRSGVVPSTNAFSFVDGTQPWIMHEWLMGPLFAWGIARLGPPFLALLALVVGTLTLTAAVASIARESRTTLTAWLSALLMLACYSDRFVSARPTGLSLVFPVILLSLTLRPRFRLREVVLSTALMLVWTNAHGSFPFGLAILALGAFSRDDRRHSDRSGRATPRVAAFVLASLATLANPYGLRLHRFVFHYLVGDEPALAVVHRRIAEFSPLWRAADWARAPVVLGLVALAALIAWGVVDPALRRRTLLCVPVLLFGVWNVRHLELSGLICLMLLVPATDALATRIGARVTAPPRWIPGLVVAGGVVGLLAWSVQAALRPRDDALLGRYRPAAALIEALPDGAHVFAPFDTAALVTWLAYPRGVLTFADPRNDCFRESTLEAFFDLETASGHADLPRSLSGFDVTHILLPDRHPQAAAVARLASWRPLLRKDDWTLLARAAPPPQD